MNLKYQFLFSTLMLTQYSCYNCEHFFAEDKKHLFEGKVVSKYRSSNHDALILETINFNEKKNIGSYDELEDLWNTAEVGDSIYKGINSLEYRLVKKDTTLSFYPECNGKKIK